MADPFPSPGADPPHIPGVHPVPDPPHFAPEPFPQPPAPSAAPTGATHSLAQSGEQCASCGAHVAADQRYCLACGARCGEPRLPFMSAVTFMDAMKTPAGASAAPPPRRPQRRISSNMALFATIGVLLLAMGVGVLIGRSGNHTVASTPAAPQVIEVGGGGETTPGKGTESGAGSAKIGGSAKKATKKVLKKEASSQNDTESVLHAKVPLVKAGTQLGGACEEGQAGCEGKKFTGKFFGE